MKVLIKNATKHIITTIVGLLVMGLGISFYSLAWLKLVDNTFSLLQLSLALGLGLVLIFSPDNLIPIILNGLKKYISK